MKRILIATAALAISASAASAYEDGAYVGANLNWSAADIEASNAYKTGLDLAGIDKTVAEPRDFTGAIRGGYDMHFDAMVLGAGVDYNFGTLEGDWKYDAATNAGGATTSKIKNATTIFARAGYDAGQFTPYVLAGYSWADMKTSVAGVSEKKDLKGMTYGVGAEHPLSDNLTAYGEWNYTDFDKVSIGGVKGLDVNVHQFKMGLNYNF